MLSGRWRKRFKVAQAFVEQEFGPGSASSKVTRNKGTMIRAQENLARAKKKSTRAARNFTRLYIDCCKTSLRVNSGSRHLVFINPEDTGRMDMIVHEATHTAYSRKRRKAGKRRFSLVDETIAHSKKADWIHANEPPESWQQHLKFVEKIRSGLERDNWNHNHILGGASFAGSVLALMIHNKFPQDIGARMRLRADLMHKGFTTFKQVANWIERYPSGKSA